VEQRIDALERDRLEMRSLKGFERFEVDRERAVVADPRQIIFQPKRV
jgi:hypothetical protein